MYATRAMGDSHNIRRTSLRFHLCYEEEESLLHLSEMKTVRDLKDAIWVRYGVPLSQQYIEGWNVKPSSDKVLLKDCSVAVNRLTITVISEAQAALSFHEKATQDGTLPIGIDFLIDLDRALHESCYAPLHLGKVLLLFLYKEHDQFSITFCKKLNEVQVKNVVQKFSVLAWDISDEKYHELLVKTLNLLQLQPLTIFIENQKSAAFCLRNVNGCIAIAACLYDDNSQQILELLKDVENRSKSDNLSNIKFFQQIMAERLSAKVTLEDGQLHLNGQPVDMDAFINMNRNRTSSYRGNLPIKSDGTPEDTVKMKTIFMQNNFNEDVEGLSEFSAKLVGSYHSDVQEMVIKSFTLLWDLLPDGVKTILDKLFNPVQKYALLFEKVFEYFVREAEKLEEQFQKWEETRDPQYYSRLFVLIDTDKKRRRRKMFEVVIRNSLRVLQMSVKDLLSYVLAWILRKLFDHFTEKKQR